MTNAIALMLPTFNKNERQKRGIITSLIMGFVGLAYEGISSFLHHRRPKALQKAVNVIKDGVDIQQNKIFHLEDSMVMHGIYNSDTLEDLLKTVHKLHNTTTWNEKLFSGQIKDWCSWYLTTRCINQYAINSILFLTTEREKYVKMYERFLNQLKLYAQAIRVLSKGYLPILLLSPSKLNLILQKVKQAVQIKNKDYDLVIKRLYLYYDMKLVTFGIDDHRNLIVQFPVFGHPQGQRHLILCQLETVPVPIEDKNEHAQSYTQVQTEKPYIALNSETYISVRIQELEACKKIDYEFYCEELFVVKHRTQHNCKSAIYFDLGADIIKENCEFQCYFNKTDVKPSVHAGGHEIILANWPNTKYVICSDNHNFPIKIPCHPYVLLKRSVLCNCAIEANDNFLWESIVASPGKPSALTMYYTVNIAFMSYFDNLVEQSEIEKNRHTHFSELDSRTTSIPIAFQTPEFDTKLLQAPKTLKDLVRQHKQKGQMLEKAKIDDNKKSFFDNIVMDIFLFIAVVLSMLATAAIIHLVCRHTKLKALVTGITFQPIKQTEALLDKVNIIQQCTAQWYTTAALTFMVIGLIIYIFTTTQRCTIFKRKMYSNTVTVMLFFSDVKQYIPVKLCKVAGSIHLFQIYGQLTSNQITLERNLLWDVIKIEWEEVFLTLNGEKYSCPYLLKYHLQISIG